jgi:hypothetical protein
MIAAIAIGSCAPGSAYSELQSLTTPTVYVVSSAEMSMIAANISSQQTKAAGEAELAQSNVRGTNAALALTSVGATEQKIVAATSTARYEGGLTATVGTQIAAYNATGTVQGRNETSTAFAVQTLDYIIAAENNLKLQNIQNEGAASAARAKLKTWLPSVIGGALVTALVILLVMGTIGLHRARWMILTKLFGQVKIGDRTALLTPTFDEKGRVNGIGVLETDNALTSGFVIGHGDGVRELPSTTSEQARTALAINRVQNGYRLPPPTEKTLRVTKNGLEFKSGGTAPSRTPANANRPVNIAHPKPLPSINDPSRQSMLSNDQDEIANARQPDRSRIVVLPSTDDRIRWLVNDAIERIVDTEAAEEEK